MASAIASKSTIGCLKGLTWDYFHFHKAECYSMYIFNIGKIHEYGANVNGKFVFIVFNDYCAIITCHLNVSFKI